jgi:hypothetical protein
LGKGEIWVITSPHLLGKGPAQLGYERHSSANPI